MARVERTGKTAVIVAESEAERELLRHGQRQGGKLVLLEGFYAVSGQQLLLPRGISERGAQRVRLALEEAARSHQEAERRRQGFRVVRD